MLNAVMEETKFAALGEQRTTTASSIFRQFAAGYFLRNIQREIMINIKIMPHITKSTNE